MIGIVVGLAIAAVVARFLVRTSIKVALGVLIATTFLIPGTVLVPGSFNGYTTIHRIVLAIFLLNLVRKIARKEIPASVLRLPRLGAALAAWVSLSFVLGVAMADTSYPISAATFLWVFIVEYAVFFFLVLAAVRAIDDPWWLAGLIAAVFIVGSGIAIFEHFSEVSFGRWLARLIRREGFLGVPPLSRRGGDVRVQAGFEFSLAYAWAATSMLPIVVVVAARARNLLMRALPALLVVSIAWTYARSAYVGVAVAGVLLLVTTRFHRAVAPYILTGLVAVLLFSVGTQVYQRTFTSPGTEGSTQVREERLPLLLASSAERPLTGKGLASVAASGIRTTDSSYLLTYAEIGVIGIGGLAMLLAAALVWVAPAVRAPPPDGLLGAACLCGMVLGIGSGAFLDTFSASGSYRGFWLLAAVGTVLAERAPRAIRARPRLRYRALIPVAGVVAGLIWFMVTPTTVATTLRFTTRSPQLEAEALGPNEFIGRTLVNTACVIIETRVAAMDQDAQCYDLQSGNGIADVRFEARDAASLDRAALVAAGVVRSSLPTVRFFRLSEERNVRPTYIRTVPVWLGMVGLALAFMVPPLPPMRRRAGSRPPIRSQAAPT